MKHMKQRTYVDPTGGGDDIEIKVPEWIDPPEELMFRDINRDAYYFTLEED